MRKSSVSIMSDSEVVAFHSDNSSEEEFNAQPKKKRKVRSQVWKYYEKNISNSKCRICGTTIESSNTTVLWRHVNKNHTEIELQEVNRTIILPPLEERLAKWIVFSMVPLYSIDNEYFRALFPAEIVGARKKSKKLSKIPTTPRKLN